MAQNHGHILPAALFLWAGLVFSTGGHLGPQRQIDPTLTPTPSASPTPTDSESPPPAIRINEIAWAGTAASAFDEWIELANLGDDPVALGGSSATARM